MANRTNKQNRTFSRTCSVCSSSAPHRTEPNNTLVRFVFGRISNIDTRVRFCSTRTRTEQYPCLVRVRQVRTTQSKAEHSVFLGAGIVDCWSNSWIGKSKQWPRKNGRGTMAEEQWSEEQWRHWGPQIQRNRNYQEFRGFRLRARSRKPPTFS